MRRKPTSSEIRSHKKQILELLAKQPMTPSQMYEHMDADIGYQALAVLETERKVRNEGLVYYHKDAKMPVKPKPKLDSIPVAHGKPAEHKRRVKNYGGELNDPTTTKDF